MSGERGKIILVDDTPVILKVARNALMSKYDVFTAPSAEKMFQFLEKALPDMILLDVMMPEMSGYEAMAKLKKDPRTKDIPVIFLTSMKDANSELEGLSLGAVDYIAKPFSPQLLLKRVDVHMLMESQKRRLEELNGHLNSLVEQKTRAVLELQRAILVTVSDLVECRDDVTGSHVDRTESFLRILVNEMQARGVYSEAMGSWDKDILIQSAQLHDVGKIAIRDSVLLKPAKLTEEEFNYMKKHTTFGELVIDKIQQSTNESMFLTHAKIMAGAHHEKWDGTGYPRGMAGFDIPLQGRMMAIADVYDALVSARPYKAAFPHEEAVNIIKSESGRHFDPVIAEVFVAASGKFH
jgi:putative two-component system response regulator